MDLVDTDVDTCLEKIVSINYHSDYTFQDDKMELTYDGYIIKTNKQDIQVFISNEQICCEGWSVNLRYQDHKYTGPYIPQLTDFIVTDKPKWKDTKIGNEADETGDKYENEFVITIPLQDDQNIKIIVRNTHNGYYKHYYYVTWKDYKNCDSF